MEDVCVDANSNVYVLGMTNSTNFPMATPGGAAYSQTTNAGGGTDLAILKLNSAGALGYASYYGGSYQDISPDHDCIQVAGGRLVVVGWTMSSNFPTQSYSGAFNDATYGGGASGDGYMIVFNSGTMERIYATYLGGSQSDACYGTAMDTDGNAYVVGYSGGGMPTAAQAGFFNDETYQSGTCVLGGPSDAFILRLDATTLAMSWATYFGGSGCDAFWGVDAFGSQRLAVVGRSGSSPDRPFFDPGNEAWFENGTSGSLQSTIAELNIVVSPVGISENSSSKLILSPNPATGSVLIGCADWSTGAVDVELFNGIGQRVVNQRFNPAANGMIRADISSLAEGCYLVRALHKSGTVLSARLVVRHD